MRTIGLLFIFLLLSVIAFSQNTLQGKVIDENNAPLSYATVTLLNPADSTLQYFGVTKEDGTFKIKSIKSRDYIIQYSFVGMETQSDNITLPLENGEDLGIRTLKATLLDEVEIVAEYVPIQFKSDTVEFNANAFTNKPHAVVEDLLKKIPGIEVDESGNMKALGEDVTKVTVDGKEFFGDDPKVATKNLPAKAIEKIQVYDKKSEEAEFMGIDDGVRDRTINLILNEDNKQGYFGEVDIAGGVDNFVELDLGSGYKINKDAEPYYKGSGNLYRFSDKLQSALLGMYNNINEFGYSGKGHGGWGQKVDGLNKTGAGGLNLSYIASKENRYFLSYLGRNTNTNREKNSEKEIFQDEGSYFQGSVQNTIETDSPHGIDFGLRHNFNQQHKITLDGDVSIASNYLNNSVLTQTLFNELLVNDIDNRTIDNSDQFSADARAVYIVKFDNEKTQLKTNFNVDFSKNTSELDQENTNMFFSPDIEQSLSQFRNNNTQSYFVSANPTLVHEIAPFWYLSGNVKVGNGINELSREQGDQITNVLIDSLGADFQLKKFNVQPGLSLKRSTSKRQYNFSVEVAMNTLEKVLFQQHLNDNTYFHVLPSFRFENNYKKGRRFNFRYRTSVSLPSVSQLLPVSNVINPENIYIGNPDLEPGYGHNISLRWSIFDQFSFTSMFMRVGGNYNQNPIGSAQTILDNFTRVTSPVNVDYAASAYGFLYFSTPIRSVGMKVNIRAGENWNNGITIVNGDENVNNSLTHSLKISVENRKKDKWHFNGGGSIALTNSKFSVSENRNNQYYNTSYFGEFYYNPTEKWIFEADGNVVNYNSKNFDDSFSIPILNAGISYFFLPGNKASISLKGYDLLDKNTSIKQVTQSNYILQEESNTIGRRIMLEAKFKIGKI